MKQEYFDFFINISTIHKMFMDNVEKELGKIGVRDINAKQFMIIYIINKQQSSNECALSVGEVSNISFYHGLNITYNLNKLEEYKYIAKKVPKDDKRVTEIHLLPKALDLCPKIAKSFDRAMEIIHEKVLTENEFNNLSSNISSLKSLMFNIVNE